MFDDATKAPVEKIAHDIKVEQEALLALAARVPVDDSRRGGEI